MQDDHTEYGKFITNVNLTHPIAMFLILGLLAHAYFIGRSLLSPEYFDLSARYSLVVLIVQVLGYLFFFIFILVFLGSVPKYLIFRRDRIEVYFTLKKVPHVISRDDIVNVLVNEKTNDICFLLVDGMVHDLNWTSVRIKNNLMGFSKENGLMIDILDDRIYRERILLVRSISRRNSGIL